MNREPKDNTVETPPQGEEATGTVLRLIPRAERARQVSPPTGGGGMDRVRTPARDGDDDDPGPTAA